MRFIDVLPIPKDNLSSKHENLSSRLILKKKKSGVGFTYNSQTLFQSTMKQVTLIQQRQ